MIRPATSHRSVEEGLLVRVTGQELPGVDAVHLLEDGVTGADSVGQTLPAGEIRQGALHEGQLAQPARMPAGQRPPARGERHLVPDTGRDAGKLDQPEVHQDTDQPRQRSRVAADLHRQVRYRRRSLEPIEHAELNGRPDRQRDPLPPDHPRHGADRITASRVHDPSSRVPHRTVSDGHRILGLNARHR